MSHHQTLQTLQIFLTSTFAPMFFGYSNRLELWDFFRAQNETFCLTLRPRELWTWPIKLWLWSKAGIKRSETDWKPVLPVGVPEIISISSCIIIWKKRLIFWYILQSCWLACLNTQPSPDTTSGMTLEARAWLLGAQAAKGAGNLQKVRGWKCWKSAIQPLWQLVMWYGCACMAHVRAFSRF